MGSVWPAGSTATFTFDTAAASGGIPLELGAGSAGWGITDPAGDVVADGVPDHPSPGLYTYAWDIPADADLGDYCAMLQGLADFGGDPLGIHLVQTFTVAGTFGTSLADVEARLPLRPNFGPSTRPSSVEAARMIADRAGMVAARLATVVVLDDLEPAWQVHLSTAARGVVAMGAAADAEAAAHPERANPNDASTYAQWLLAQWKAGLDALLELAARATVAGEAGDVGGAMAGVEAPPPTFTLRDGF